MKKWDSVYTYLVMIIRRGNFDWFQSKGNLTDSDHKFRIDSSIKYWPNPKYFLILVAVRIICPWFVFDSYCKKLFIIKKIVLPVSSQ